MSETKTAEEQARALWEAIELDWPKHPDDGRVREREEAIMAAALRAASQQARAAAFEEAAGVAAAVAAEDYEIADNRDATESDRAAYRFAASGAEEVEAKIRALATAGGGMSAETCFYCEKPIGGAPFCGVGLVGYSAHIDCADNRYTHASAVQRAREQIPAAVAAERERCAGVARAYAKEADETHARAAHADVPPGYRVRLFIQVEAGAEIARRIEIQGERE